MRTSTRSAISGREPFLRPLAREPPAVGEVAVAVAARCPAAPSRGSPRPWPRWRCASSAAAQKAVNGTAAAASHTTRDGVAEVQAGDAAPPTRLSKGRSRKSDPSGSERADRSASKAGSSASNPINGWWKSARASASTAPGQRVDAGDRERVDRVAEVGRGGLAPREDRVGERLQRAVHEVHVGHGRRRVQQPLGVGNGRGHGRAQPEHTGAAQEAAPREVIDERRVPGARPCHPRHCR